MTEVNIVEVNTYELCKIEVNIEYLSGHCIIAI